MSKNLELCTDLVYVDNEEFLFSLLKTGFREYLRILWQRNFNFFDDFSCTSMIIDLTKHVSIVYVRFSNVAFSIL